MKARELEAGDRFRIDRVRGGAVHVVVRQGRIHTHTRPVNSREGSKTFTIHHSTHVTRVD